MIIKYELVIDGVVIASDETEPYQAIDIFEWEIRENLNLCDQTYENLYDVFEPDENGWTAVYFDHIVEIRRA